MTTEVISGGTAVLPRPRVGISACLTGLPVRYDGGHKLSGLCTGPMAELLEWVPLCPEVAVGLGVPRPTIDLFQEENHVIARNRDDPGLDPSQAILDFAQTVGREHPDLCGYVFMARSPSCALASGRLYQDGQLISTRAAGLFADRWRHEHPLLPVMESSQLENRPTRLCFLIRAQVTAVARRLTDAPPGRTQALENCLVPLMNALVAPSPGEWRCDRSLIQQLAMGQWREIDDPAGLVGVLESLAREEQGEGAHLCRRLLLAAGDD